VVWKGTKEMGVGRATARSGNIYVVANYAPGGNMQGAFQANVLPLGNYNIPVANTTPKKTGLEGEVCDIVNTKGGEPVKTIAESVYKHLEAKKPDSHWLVVVLSGCKAIGKKNLVKEFTNWDLGKAEDKDLVVLEFEKPHSKEEADETVLNEDWGNKVKLAFLEAQRGKEKGLEILEKADELFPELKSYQRIIFKKTDAVSHHMWHNLKLFYFYKVVGDWLVLITFDPTKPRKTGLAKEICDIVNAKGEETVKSIAESVYNHLDTKKPESLWIVGIVSGCRPIMIARQTFVKGFMYWKLGNKKEDKDLVVYEFQHPHDETGAKATVMNEVWINKVKLAFLEAQRGKDSASQVLEKADELFPELKKYQRIIFKNYDTVSYQWWHSTKLFYFCQVIGDWLVMVIESPKTPAPVEPSEPVVAETTDDSLSNTMENLQVDQPALGYTICIILSEKFLINYTFDFTEVEVESASPVPNPSSSGNKKVCTFVTGKGALIEQHMYHCATCELNDEDTCICKVCIKLCHKGHDVSLAGIGKSFCDCGSDDTEGACKAITKLLNHLPINICFIVYSCIFKIVAECL